MIADYNPPLPFFPQADPLFNGSGVARSIQHMRNYHRISCGPEPMQAKVSGAPMHPWSMYTDKGGVPRVYYGTIASVRLVTLFRFTILSTLTLGKLEVVG